MFYTQTMNLGAMDLVSPFFQHVYFGKCLGPDGSLFLKIGFRWFLGTVLYITVHSHAGGYRQTGACLF